MSSQNEDPKAATGADPELFESVDSAAQPTLAETLGLDDEQNLPEQEFFIPVHGFVEFTSRELEVINHPAFQRLARIYQLGQAYYVYRGATHKRLEHVLGTVHVAGKIAEAIDKNFLREKRRAGRHESGIDSHNGIYTLDEPLSDLELAYVRLAALLHDIGHLPAGHTLEDELCLLSKHDELDRLNHVLDKSDWPCPPGFEPKTLREVINGAYAGTLEGLKESPSDLAVKLITKEDAEDLEKDGKRIVRISVCRDIVGNTICADLLDYLYRDWHHVGRPKFWEERLFQYMQIRKNQNDGHSQFVISLGRRSRPKTDAVTSILGLLESRYELSEAVLFHPTKCAAAAMLERGIQILRDGMTVKKREKWDSQLVDELLQRSDEETISWLTEESKNLSNAAAERLFSSLQVRHLYKSIFTFFRNENETAADQMAVLYAPDRERERARRSAANRKKALEKIEEELDLPKGSVAMYSPADSMNSKIAQVKILNKTSLKTLSEHDKATRLAGGHCESQIHRFRNLWRVELYLCADVLNGKSSRFIGLMQKVARAFVFGVENDPNTLADIAAEAARVEDSPFHGRKALKFDNPSIAAQFDASTGYPSGANGLSSFFE